MNENTFDVIVAGGGLAGFTAAVSAARIGARVALVQNRPVLGGNSSSEIRVPVGGACDFNPWARESGILEEFFLKERTRDPRRIWLGETPSLWDITLYEMAKEEQNLTLLLNTAVDAVYPGDGTRIDHLACSTAGNESSFVLSARIYIDATGDGFVAARAGADFRIGREARNEFGEDLAPEVADDKVMGSSLLFHAEDVGHPVPFDPPAWAPRYPHDSDLGHRTHDDIRAGYWWIEVGNPPYDTIRDNEKVRDELYAQLLAVWDHIKNRRNHGADNLHIDFIGAVPGKRESRRVMGDYIMTESDIRKDSGFPDAVAYGGWFCDLHTMGGILSTDESPEPSFDNDPAEVDRRQMYTYSIPLRSLYSRNIDNLMMAGRDISVSHVALGSTRLMATCAAIGQAVGTTAAMSARRGVSPREMCRDHVLEVQQQLLKDDCYIPGIANEDPLDLARTAAVTASSSSVLSFEHGIVGDEYEYPKQRSFGRSGLQLERAELFPFSSDHLDAIDFELASTATRAEELHIALYHARSLVGFSASRLLFEQTVTVTPGFSGFLNVPFNIAVPAHSLLWVSLHSTDGIYWLYSNNPPTGTASASRIVSNWKPQKGSYGIRLSPESRPYECENLLSGRSRPEEWTNIWISDPAAALPAWVQYTFDRTVELDTIHLTFDTNLNLAHMAVPGLYRAPECVRDYRILARTHDDPWIEVERVRNNFQRTRIHHFAPLQVDALKVEADATNGSPSARLYELRAYFEGSWTR